jgi:hypothetical protein
MSRVFTARYALSPYIKTRLVFKGLRSGGAVPGHKTKGVWSWQITSIQRPVWEKKKALLHHLQTLSRRPRDAWHFIQTSVFDAVAIQTFSCAPIGPAVCPTIRMHQQGCIWTDYHDVIILEVSLKFTHTCQIWLKSDKNKWSRTDVGARRTRFTRRGFNGTKSSSNRSSTVK